MKILNTSNIILAGIALMFVWMGYATYLKYEPFQTPIINTDTFKVLNPNKQVVVGGTLNYQLDYCAYRKVPTTNTRTIEEIGGSERVYFLATTVSEGVQPGCKVVSISFPLSRDIQPGTYKVKSVAEYRVNQLETVSKTFYSEEFKIVEASKSAK